MNMISSALFTDFYELTMAQGYWKENMNQEVVFDMFFRKNPFNGGFSILAGNETLMDILVNFRFSEDDIKYLAEQKIFEQGFLDFDAPGIDEAKTLSEPFRGAIKAVAGDARGVFDDGKALADETVEQRGFTDVRGADESDQT
jgi:hypothetical protein